MKRGLAVTAAVTLVTVVFVVASGFAVQVAALGRPSPDALLVVKVVAKLMEYRGSHSEFVFNGRRMSETCAEGWAKRSQVTVVGIAGGATLTETATHLEPAGLVPDDEFMLAGCPRVLSKWLGTQLNHGSKIEIRHTRLRGRGAVEVSFVGLGRDLRVYLDSSGDLPLALSLHGPGVLATSRLDYGISHKEFTLLLSTVGAR